MPPGDATALVRALLTLIRDEGLHWQMGQASWDKVVRQFNVKDSAARVANSFAEELGR